MDAELSIAKELGGTSKEIELQRTLAAAQLGRLKHSERILPDLLLRDDSDGGELCEAFINGYAINYRFNEAARLIDVWKMDFPTDPQPYFVEGMIHEQNREFPPALAAYRHAQSRDAKRLDVRKRIFYVYLETNEFERALDEYRFLKSQGINDVRLRIGRLKCELGLGKLDGIESEIEAALHDSPDDYECVMLAARYKLLRGSAVEAVEILRANQSKHSNDSQYLYLLGRALASAGKTEEGEVLLKRAASIEESLVEVRQLMDRVIQDPTDTHARFNIGRKFMSIGYELPGVEWLKTVLEFSPSHSESRRMLFDYYSTRGDTVSAAQYQSKNEPN